MDVPLFAGAFVAGMLMFLAPCTLPVVPGYLAFIAGIPLSALTNPAAKRGARKVVFKNALAFVFGFSIVFILLGATFWRGSAASCLSSSASLCSEWCACRCSRA